MTAVGVRGERVHAAFLESVPQRTEAPLGAAVEEGADGEGHAP